MPLVSILMPYLEQSEHPDSWMRECLESIRAQTFTDWELLWTGDPPRLPFQTPPMWWVQNRGGRMAENVNLGAIHAQSKYYAHINSNDTIDPDYLAFAVDALESGRPWFAPNTSEFNQGILKDNPMNAMVIRREVWNEMGGYKPSPLGIQGMEDWHLWQRLWLKGYRDGVCCPKDLYHWRRHEPTSLIGKVAGTADFDRNLAWMRQDLREEFPEMAEMIP